MFLFFFLFEIKVYFGYFQFIRSFFIYICFNQELRENNEIFHLDAWYEKVQNFCDRTSLMLNVPNAQDDEIKRVVNAYNNLSSKYESLTNLKKELQSNLASTNSEVDNLISKIRKYDQKSKKRAIEEKDKDKNITELQNLESQKANIENQMFEMTNYLEKAVQKLCQEKKKRIKASNKKKESIADLQKLTSVVQSLKSQPSTNQIYTDLYNKYKNLLEKLNAKQEQMNQQYEKMKKDAELADEESKSKELQLKEIQNEISEIEGRLRRRDETISCLDGDIQDLSYQKDSINGEICKIETAKNGVNSSIEILSKSLGKLQQKSGEIGTRYKKENSKISELTKYLISFNNECDTKIADITDQLEKESNEEILKVKQKLDAKQSEIDEIQNNIAQIETDTHTIQAKIESYERERQEETKQINLMNENSKILFGAMQQIMSTISNPALSSDSPLLGRTA